MALLLQHGCNMALLNWLSMDKPGSHWGQQVAKGKQKVEVPALPIRSPFKPVWLQLMEMTGCAGEGQQQTGETQMGYVGAGEQISLTTSLSAAQDT